MTKLKHIIALCTVFLLAGAALAGDGKWGYEGKIGPEYWGSLTKEFALCDDGKEQSPIDIQHVHVVKDQALPSFFQAAPLEVYNNGHTIQVNVAPGSYSIIDGKRYELLQYHFHAPSENKLGGEAFDMDAHFVHKADDGSLAVIGVFMEAGSTPNAAIAQIWANAPLKGGETNKGKGEMLNPAVLLPEDNTFFRFMGSLTTPPCSEGLVWSVYEQPIHISTEQLETFLKVIGNNARPVQPLNERKVKMQGE